LAVADGNSLRSELTSFLENRKKENRKEKEEERKSLVGYPSISFTSLNNLGTFFRFERNI